VSDRISYTLKVDGRPASAEVLEAIREIQVEDHAELADMLRLRLALSVRQDGSGWTLIDDGPFRRLAKIQLSITVGSGKAIPLIEAHVVETDARFSNEPGASVLTVVAMDPSVLMHLEEKVKAWPDMADSDVASEIFNDRAYGFSPVVEATKYTRNSQDHTLIQRGTDIQFLQRLAERNGFECFVQLDPSSGKVEGHCHPPRHDQQSQGTLTVNMGAATNVNRFRVRNDMLGPTTAQATTVDVDDASDQSGSAETTSRKELGRETSSATDRPRKTLLSQLGMGKSGEVQRYAQAVVDRSSWAIVAEGELNTVAYGGVLRAKRPVTARGAGREASGTYYVERVLHTIRSDGSYTQAFTLRRNALGATGQERFTEDNAA
jgi:phage protein D